MADTIYALATPPGRSGVAVIRISGTQAFEVASKLTGAVLTPRHAHFLTLKSKAGEMLDEAVVIGFQAPASFTGEDVVELQIHGSRAAIVAVSNEIEGLGVRLAEAGEFTRRALENDKLDMLQVESLADFINSDTEIQRKQSLRGFSGRDSEWVDNLRSQLVETSAWLTASIDFVDQELPEDLLQNIAGQIQTVKQTLERELDLSQRAINLKDGFRVTILGRPNVGKSSLLNALAGREIAIATDIPGTTRDVIEAYVDLGGLPIIFQDTAGIRESDDAVERIGVERATQAAATGDLRIFLYENHLELNDFADHILEDDILVQAKSDLYLSDEFSISAKTGEGINQLLELVKKHFEDVTQELGRFAHARQILALQNSVVALEEAQSRFQFGEDQLELIAESLRQAIFSLDHLVGRVDVEDMLDVIFSQFCIGK